MKEANMQMLKIHDDYNMNSEKGRIMSVKKKVQWFQELGWRGG